MAGLPQAGVQLVAQDLAAFQSALKAATQSVEDFGTGAEKSSGGFAAFADKTTSAMKTVGTAVLGATAAAGAAVVAFGVSSVKAAGDFEAGMNRFASVTGKAVNEVAGGLEGFRALFLKLGADTQYSAAQAEDAAINLAKGGLTPAQIAGGALADTLTLAAAGELDLAAAAEITAKQLGVWASTGTTSAQVANLLAQAANASTVDVDELALGLANVGGIAKTAGLSFQETVQTMALLAPGFSSAADAGTSFKTFLTRLQPTTSTATAAMEDLGLYTEATGSKFYDASGNFIGMEAAAQLLKGSLTGLSEAQKVAALQAIFGQDAFRAAALIAEQGAAGFDAMGVAMAGTGTAAEQAAQRNQGFNFALEQVRGSIETLQIVIGSALLPVLTSLLNDYITPGINTMLTFSQALMGNQDAFNQLSPALQSVATTIQYLSQVAVEAYDSLGTDGLSGAISTFGAGLDAILPGSASFTQSLLSWAPVLQPIVDLIGGNLQPILISLAAVLAGSVAVAIGSAVAAFVAAVAPIAALVAAGALLYSAWQSDFGGIQGIVAGTQSKLIAFGNTEWGQTLQRGAQVVAAYFTGPFAGDLQRGISVAQGGLNTLAASPWWQQVQRGASVVAAYMTGPFPGDFQRGAALAASAWQTFTADFGRGVALVKSGVATWIADVARGAAQVKSWYDQAMAAWHTFTSDFQRGVAYVNASVNEWIATIQRGAGQVKAAFVEVINAIKAAWSGLVASAAGLGKAFIDGIAGGIRSAAGAVVDAARSVVDSAMNAASSALRSRSPSKRAADEIGKPFDEGIAKGITDNIQLVTTATNDLADMLVAGFEEGGSGVGGGAVIARGHEGGKRFVGSIFSGILENAPALMKEAGRSVDEGLAKGISDNIQPVEDAGKDAGASLTKSMQSALEIGSPSGVAADQVGTPFMQGIVQGMEDSFGLLKKMASKLSKNLTKIMTDIAADATKAFREMIQAGLQADVTGGKQKLENLTTVQDLAGDTDAQKKILDKKKAIGEKIEVMDSDRLAKIHDIMVSNLSVQEKEKKIRDLNAEVNPQIHQLEVELQLLDAQLAKEQQLADARKKMADAAAKEFADAQARFEEGRKTDAEKATRRFELESKQIADRYKLMQDINEAHDKGDYAEQARLEARLELLKQIQASELELLASQEAQKSPLDDTIKKLKELEDLLKQEATRDQKFADLTTDAHKKAGRLAEAEQDRIALKKIQDLLALITAGVTSGAAGALGGAGADAAAAIIEEAKKVLGIGSPSKVAAKELGIPAGQGLVLGLSKALSQQSGAIVGALGGMGGMVAPPASAAQLSRAAAMPSAGSTNSSSFTYAPTYHTQAMPPPMEAAVSRALAGA